MLNVQQIARRADDLRIRPEPSPARILVVDDDATARAALEKLLREEGFVITTACDGEDALVEAKRDPPDIVITDLSMPRLGGVELCRRLHELHPDLPVIVVTAHADTPSAVASLRAGVDDYLTKPLDIEVLLHGIERTLERRNTKMALAQLTEQTCRINERLILTSIRERENAEATELHRAQLSALLENLSDGVLIADAGGRILMANRAAREMWLGRRVIEDVHQLNLLEGLRVDGTPCPIDERPLTRALRGEVFDHHELLRIKADGDVRRIVASGTNVSSADGNVELAIVVFRDVTDLRKLERQRGDYIALITHDLRGPLNSIVMSASILGEATRNEEAFDAAPMIERVARNAQRMNAMIAELLESTTLESEGVELLEEPCDLRTIVTAIISDLDDAGRRRVVFEGNETEARVLAQPAKMGRAITNLITNALKYSPEDAAVRVVLSRRSEDVVLEVVDQGIGIAAVQVPRLFERYYRAPSGKRFSGLGLGLYITGLIVRAHGGRVEVVSEVGKGSTFRLLLPLRVAHG